MDDTVLTDGYQRFAGSHDCFLDGILCDPELRSPFVKELQSEFAGYSEAEILSRLVYLRKRGTLARKKPR